MIRKHFINLSLFLVSTNLLLAQIPYNHRYNTAVFDEISVESDVIYGNAPALAFPYLNENNTYPQDLLMDIFKPVGDALNSRPVLICVHSGAFVSGTKLAEDMVAFCDSMAHRGYVTASIEYRLGMNIFSSESSTRAVYRGLQDGRAAIRYLKEHADVYGIDTSNIYMLGSSAGGYVGLHNLYMDTEDERPPETYISPDLGCLDCSGNSYQHSGRVNGLIALWGALQDTLLIIQQDTIPVYLAHGTADETVPFGYGSAFGNTSFPATYGSSLIAEQIENFGNYVHSYFVEGEDHEFYGTDNGDWPGTPNAYWDTVFNKTDNFMYDIHKPIAGFAYGGYGIFDFYDESILATSWYWNFGDGTYSSDQNPTHEYTDEGYYKVTQFVKNDLDSWDTISLFVDFFVDIEEDTQSNFRLYPNPAVSFVTIHNTSDQNLNVRLISVSGKEMVKVDVRAYQKFSLPIESYSSGLYYVSVSNGSITTLEKLIIY